jgi:hypothetical protein
MPRDSAHAVSRFVPPLSIHVFDVEILSGIAPQVAHSYYTTAYDGQDSIEDGKCSIDDGQCL